MDVITLRALVADKIHLKLLTDTVAAFVCLTYGNYSHINVISSSNQLVVDDILHGVSFLNLTEVNSGVAKSYIAEIILLRSVDILSALYIIAGGTAYDKSVTEIVKIAFYCVLTDGLVLLAFEGIGELFRVGE